MENPGCDSDLLTLNFEVQKPEVGSAASEISITDLVVKFVRTLLSKCQLDQTKVQQHTVFASFND